MVRRIAANGDGNVGAHPIRIGAGTIFWIGRKRLVAVDNSRRLYG